jgi:hypothetical protein
MELLCQNHFQIQKNKNVFLVKKKLINESMKSRLCDIFGDCCVDKVFKLRCQECGGLEYDYDKPDFRTKKFLAWHNNKLIYGDCFNKMHDGEGKHNDPN